MHLNISLQTWPTDALFEKDALLLSLIFMFHIHLSFSLFAAETKR